MQRAIPAPEAYRSPEYDYWMAYYDKHFRGKTPDDLGERRMKQAIALRNWLNEEQTKRREPHLIQGFLPRDHAARMVRRFRLVEV